MSNDRQPGVLHCSVPGDLTSSTAKGAREEIERALSAFQASSESLLVLEVDLQQARFVDSVGINLLVLLIRRVKEQDGAVRLLVSNSNVRRVLSFMRVDQHAEIVMKNG